MAGADSTSIALRAIFYYTMKHPYTMQKLQAEIDTAFAAGQITSPVKYNDAIRLPYLNAVVKESMRLFPSYQVSMQRLVPKQGIVLSDVYIPAGYRVGINPGCIHYNKEVFGEDAYEFRPERWLESEERTKVMEKAIITFGAGTRTCTGRNVSGRLAFVCRYHETGLTEVNASWPRWRFIKSCHIFCSVLILRWLTMSLGKRTILRLLCSRMLYVV